jgi:hypothetical protein
MPLKKTIIQDEIRLDDKVTHKYVHSWDGLCTLYRDEFQHANEKENKYTERNNLWIYRGQEHYDWTLDSLLRRYFKGFGIKKEDYRDKELGLIRKFQREYQHYNQFIPKQNDLIHWLSIMQHYSVPTRLLDFNYSIYIALLFALKDIKKLDKNNCNECACIWAIESRWLDKQIKEYSAKNSTNNIINQLDKKIPTSIDNYDIYKKNIYGVYPINPLELNERLRVQQGLFLIPFNINESWEMNLCKVIERIPKEETKSHIIKIHLCLFYDFVIDSFRELKRMELTASTIYPGLQGFGESLRQLIPLEKEFLDPGE